MTLHSINLWSTRLYETFMLVTYKWNLSFFMKLHILLCLSFKYYHVLDFMEKFICYRKEGVLQNEAHSRIQAGPYK